MKSKIGLALITTLSFVAPAFAQMTSITPVDDEYAWRAPTRFFKHVSFSMGGVGTQAAPPLGLTAQGKIASLVTPLTSSSTAATTASVILPTNTLKYNSTLAKGDGKLIHVKIYGTTAANGNTKVVNFTFGSTTIAILNAASNAKDFYADIAIYETAANAQEICVAGHANNALLNGLSVSSTQTTANTITVGVTVPTSTAASDVTLNGFEVYGES